MPYPEDLVLPGSILDQLLGLEAPEFDQTVEPGFQQGGGSRFVEGLSGLENAPTRAPRNFGEGLMTGFTRGLGGAGSRIRQERMKFEGAAQERQRLRDAANLQATRDYRLEKGRLLKEKDKTDREDKRRQQEHEFANPPVTQAHLNDMPWLARTYKVGDRAPASTLNQKPDAPPKPEKPGLGFDPGSLTSLNSAIRTDPDIKKMRDVKFGYALVQTGASLNTPQGDLSLIFGYMKMLDPESVVREGEYANAENTRGVPEEIRQRYNKILSGDKLSPQQRKDFTSAAAAIFDKVRPASEGATGRYRKQARALSVPEDLLFEDEAPAMGSAGSRATGGGGGKVVRDPKTGKLVRVR